MWSQTLFQNIYILRRPGVTNIADIIKIAIKLTRAAFKTQQIRKNVLKCNFYVYFLIQQNLLISDEKRLLSAELKGCVAFITYFCIFFRSGITMSSFILLRYVQQILGRVEGLLGSKSSEKAHPD